MSALWQYRLPLMIFKTSLRLCHKQQKLLHQAGLKDSSQSALQFLPWQWALQHLPDHKIKLRNQYFVFRILFAGSNPRMVEIRHFSTLLLLQQPHVSRTKERQELPSSSRFQVAQCQDLCRQILHERCSRVYLQNWTCWIDYLYYTGPPFRILANGLRPKVKALHSIHGAKHGTIRVESGIYGSNFSPLSFSASGWIGGKRLSWLLLAICKCLGRWLGQWRF